MKRILLFCAALWTFFAPALAAQSASPQPAAQSPGPASADLSSRVPPAKPADVSSIDAILHAVYDVISGPAGERDWNRFRSLFVPEARLTSAVKREGASAPVRLLTVDDYVKGAGGYFAKNGFFESAIVNRVERFGNIAQVFSSYASRHAADDKPFTRGINSIQLFYDGSRWWVLSILWDEESDGNPLPKELAPAVPANQK
ncbi:MAG TPA: hypothetical protein VE263_07565 [Candidatus Angelobacter sp.]|nr:hypothetical protein [Candidatus Angelobacter sp.]